MVVRILALVLLAGTVTATTTIAAFMEEITRLMAPIERLGLLKAADVALALGLVLRFVPDIFNRYGDIREAHRARGLKPKWRTLLGPLIILTLKMPMPSPPPSMRAACGAARAGERTRGGKLGIVAAAATSFSFVRLRICANHAGVIL